MVQTLRKIRTLSTVLIALQALVLGSRSITPASANEFDSSPLHLQTFKTHTRVSVNVDPSVEVKLKSDQKGFELFLPGLGLADLGAPLGGEREWAKEQAQLADSRLNQLSLEEVPGGVRIKGEWKYPSGDQAPAEPFMERFDYRIKSPRPQYVLDFWLKEGPTVAEVRAEKERQERLVAAEQARKKAKVRQQRKVASVQAKQEAERINLFCEEPLAENKDVFLAFTPVRDDVELKKWFPLTRPDSDYVYLVPTTDAKDAQYVRLALDLYQQGKPGLVIKTLDFFEKEHPKSTFRTEMRFLRANALLKLGMDDHALQILKEIKIDDKESSMALYSSMYLAARAMKQNAHLAALDEFLWLINTHGGHRLVWLFHLGAAEALYAMKDTARAAKEYQWVAMNAPTREQQAAGALRMGDLYLQRQQYAQALAAYYQGLSQYQKEAQTYPPVYLNRAESLYWLGQHDRSKEAFKDFLTKYPNHPDAWRATYRLGEIEGRQKSKEAEKASRKWFYDTINRYPYTAGATLARLRLLPCGDQGGFTAEAAKKFFEGDTREFEEKFGRGGGVLLGGYKDYRALARIRSLITFAKYDEALEQGIHELRSGLDGEVRDRLSALMEKLFRKRVLALLDDGKKLEALNLYQEKYSLIPKQSDGVTARMPEYLLKLSQAASDLELGTLGAELAHAYEKATRMGEGRNLAADQEDLEKKLKESAKHFTEAKALWAKASPKETQTFESIRTHLSYVIEESPASYGKEIILGLLEEKAGNLAKALRHAIRAQLLQPRGQAESADAAQDEIARLKYWVAHLQGKSGEGTAAIRVLRDLEKSELKSGVTNLAKSLGVPSLPEKEQLMLAQAEIYSRQSKWGEAATAYSRALESASPEKKHQIMYEYARVLERNGGQQDLKKAAETLEALAGSKEQDFWTRLAHEALANDRVITSEP